MDAIEVLEKRYDGLLKEFVKMTPGTEEYDVTEKALDGLQRKILSLREYENKRDDTELKRQQDAIENEKNRDLQKCEGRKERWTKICQAILGGVIAVGLSILTGDLSEITILDKNRFNIASKFFPRG